jgi:hypothetical protein
MGSSMVRTRGTRLTLALAAVLGLLLLAGAAAAGPSGQGRMAVVPTSLSAGSTGNELTLTYTADRAALSGQTIVDVPRGWTQPQRSDPTAPGYVELKRGTCGPATRLASISGRRLTIATACRHRRSYQLLYHKATASTIAADGYIFLTQTRPSGRKAKFRPLGRRRQPVVKVRGGAAAGLGMTVTSIATAGVAFTATVRGIDPYGNNAFPYAGTVRLTSTDPRASLPGPYTYVSTDSAQHAFTGVILRSVGPQRITATDSSGFTVQSPPITVSASS